MKEDGTEQVGKEFKTSSGITLKEVFLPEDLEWFDYYLDSGFPGEFPFTRGLHHTMYRGRPWSVRQYAGYDTLKEANAAYLSMLGKGDSNLPVVFDLPTQKGFDSDHSSSVGEVGQTGLAVDSLEDLETLFDGIQLESSNPSIDISASACFLLAMYAALATKRRIELKSLRGSLENDTLKDYFTEGTCIFPPEAAVRLTTDILEYTANEMPLFNPLRINAFEIREAGASAVQELAFSLSDANEYVGKAISAGLDVDCFAPRISFLFSTQSDFLEEVAKFRAARKLWAKIIKERFGASSSESCRLRLHCRTSSASLHKEEHDKNIVRSVLQSLAAVFGGTQSLRISCSEEDQPLASEEFYRLAADTQQIIARESGIGGTADPLGGSYCVEWLTRELELKAAALIHKIDGKGGMLKAVVEGFVQGQISQPSSLDIPERGMKPKESGPVIHKKEKKKSAAHRKQIEAEKVKNVARLRKKRDQGKVDAALNAVREAAEKGKNIMPPLVEASLAYATIGDMAETLKRTFGLFQGNSRSK